MLGEVLEVVLPLGENNRRAALTSAATFRERNGWSLDALEAEPATGLRQLPPAPQRVDEHAADLPNVLRVERAQEHAARCCGVDPLPRAGRAPAAGVMALFGNLLEEPTLHILATLQPTDFIGDGHEGTEQLLNFGIGPDGPPVPDAVVSRAAERVAVHGP